jgi:ABC-type transport system involved in multi-copper enzyme maturation permease subunit
MARGWGLGPVFALEWLTASRRWQVYAGRALFVGVLLLGLSSVWASRASGEDPPTIQAMAELGRGFFRAIVFTQLTLVLLAAPAATAGAVCQDKARGNLAQLLVTDLSDAEIVLGKLAARLVPVLGMVCCALPVLALGTLLGGIDPLALAGSFLVTVSVAVLGCAIALAFSVWGSKPYEVLLATFAVFTVWLLAVPVWEFFHWLGRLPPLPRWAESTNPYMLSFAPYVRAGQVGVVDFAAFAGAALVVTAALVVLSVHRLRAVVVGQADRPAARRPGRGVFRTRADAGLASGGHPVLWYEGRRRQPSAWVAALIGLYYALAVGFSLLAIDDSLRPGTPVRGWFPAYVTAFLVTMGVPLLLVAASTALVEERVRGSLDVLLTTPLSTPGIVLAKWWSVFRKLPLLLLLPTLVAEVLSWEEKRLEMVGLLVLFMVSAGAAWTSVGLALSTWVPRVGRAVSLAVALYAFVGLGWPILVMTVFSGYYHAPGPGLAMASPFHGTFLLTFGIEVPTYVEGLVAWGLAWTAVNLVVAVVLLLATLATFNRCLGRTPERARRGAAPPGPSGLT